MSLPVMYSLVYICTCCIFFCAMCGHSIAGKRIRMVLDHSVSRSSGNAYSRTQTVKGGRRVYERIHVGMTQEPEKAVDMSATSSPSHATRENGQTTRGQRLGQLNWGSEHAGMKVTCLLYYIYKYITQILHQKSKVALYASLPAASRHLLD